MSAYDVNLEMSKSQFTMEACEAIFQQNFNVALAAYERFIELDPTDFHGYDGKATTLRLLGREEEELEVRVTQLAVCEEAIRRDERDLGALQSKAHLLVYFTRVDEALATYEHILHIDPDNWMATRQKGMLLEDLGRVEEAAPYMEKAHLMEIDAREKILVFQNDERAGSCFP